MNYSYKLTADEFIEGLSNLSSKNKRLYRIIHAYPDVAHSTKPWYSSQKIDTQEEHMTPKIRRLF